MLSASRSEIEVDKVKRDVFEIDWDVVRIIFDTREIADPADVVDKLIALKKNVNS